MIGKFFVEGILFLLMNERIRRQYGMLHKDVPVNLETKRDFCVTLAQSF